MDSRFGAQQQKLCTRHLGRFVGKQVWSWRAGTGRMVRWFGEQVWRAGLEEQAARTGHLDRFVGEQV